MNSYTNDKILAWLALASGLSISAVTVYYSVAGLTAIFAAAVLPIIVMGTVLELSKLVATVWLKYNWKIAPWSIRLYLLSAILILMLITSIGCFGYLSKAHSDQTLISGDAQAKLALYEEQIKIEKEKIETARLTIRQLDAAVDQALSRSSTEQGVNRSVQIRRAQQKERASLVAEITQSQKKINELNLEKAPLAAEMRKIEAEVGPIKYIAAVVYGDQLDSNLLEKAVRWVTILIVVVLDPLAVVLLLASQISFQNIRNQKSNPVTVSDLQESEQSIPESKESVEPLLDQESNTAPADIEEPVLEPKKSTDQDNTVEANNSESVDVDQMPATNEAAIQLQEAVKQHGYSSESGIVKVAGKVYSKQDFDKLMNEPLYVQNEEQTQSSRWNTISQEDYLKSVKVKQQKE